MSMYTCTNQSRELEVEIYDEHSYNQDLKDAADNHSLSPVEPDDAPIDTGLVDQYGNTIVRMPEEKPIGFLWNLHEKS